MVSKGIESFLDFLREAGSQLNIAVDVFYKKTWFLTEEEAESALAKMDGGNEDV